MKRRLIGALLCCLLVIFTALPVLAENKSPYVENITTVTSDGACRVTLQISVHLDTADENLTFPLPENARDVMLNGGAVRAYKADGALQVDVTGMVGGYAGDYTLRFDYTLDQVVTAQEGKLHLTLPILCGFAYPVEELEFSINMPGEVTARPYFTGGYRQSTMESIMTVSVNGTLISGSVNETLDDKETVTMTMKVPPEMFPTVSVFQREGNPEIVPMLILAGIALLYWLLTLRAFPIFHSHRPTPPEGITAGEMGCRLTFAGADLTATVFTWAQLGYILIHFDDHGRVILHKRMEMGNERSLFEVNTFKALFGTRRMVEATGYQYAKLRQKLSRQIPGERAMCTARSGSRKFFRTLCCGIQVIGGVCLAMNFTANEFLQLVYVTVFSVFGGLCAWQVQRGMYCLHLREKGKLWVALGFGALWLLLNILAGIWAIGLLTVLAQMLAGLASAYGGRRSEMGWQNAYGILGYRNYMMKLSREDAQRLQRTDPELFYNMAPYALALGVDKALAKSFSHKKLPDCPYFVCGRRERQTAEIWARDMREAMQAMDDRFRHMERERFYIVRFR